MFAQLWCIIAKQRLVTKFKHPLITFLPKTKNKKKEKKVQTIKEKKTTKPKSFDAITTKPTINGQNSQHSPENNESLNNCPTPKLHAADKGKAMNKHHTQPLEAKTFI